MRFWLLVVAIVIPVAPACPQDLAGKDRVQVLQSVIDHLEREYVLPNEGSRGAARLKQALASNELSPFVEGTAFAAAVTKLLRDSTGDGHLKLEHSAKALDQAAKQADAEFTAQEMERYYGSKVNHGVRKVEQLAENVGLLELSVFPPASMGGDTIAAAMNVIAHTDALIIDLRNNGGGVDTVTLVASYLFDQRQPLSGIYNRARDHLTQSYTQPYVPGSRFGASKPVYVLISKRTFSAAEALAYDLQALKRATIIGQPSGGGAHPFEYRRIHPHFVLWSVTQKSVNPITGGNWQGTGVRPDIPIEPDRALEKALELIKERRSM
jgi:C-terminal processing protease CtpA/Prc